MARLIKPRRSIKYAACYTTRWPVAALIHQPKFRDPDTELLSATVLTWRNRKHAIDQEGDFRPGKKG